MITREELGVWMSIDSAGNKCRSFFDDHVTYPDDDFYSRPRGIFRDIPDELWPIYLLARYLPDTDAVRLSPPSSPGPDGQIRLRDGSVLGVQVTSSMERDGGYSERLQLGATGWHMTAVRPTTEVVEERLSRILDAIVEKERRYRQGADVLVIRERWASWGTFLNPKLKEGLAVALSNQAPSKYSSTFIIFNEEVCKVR